MHWETKKPVTCFIEIFTLLQWSGTKPEISPRYSCNGWLDDSGQFLRSFPALKSHGYVISALPTSQE